MALDIDEFMRWALGIQFLVVYVLVRGIFSGMTLGEANGRKWKESPLVALGLTVLAIPWGYLVFIYFFSPESMPRLTIGMPVVLRWLGFAASLPICVYLIWIFKTIGTAGSKYVITFDDMKLATHGPYSRIRHPMYTAMFFHGITWLLFTDQWGPGGGFVVIVVFLVVFRVPHEEKVLLEHFGDEYRQYMLRTGRFLPRRSRSD